MELYKMEVIIDYYENSFFACNIFIDFYTNN